MSPNPQNIHYNTLRQFLGYLGFALPTVLIAGSYLNGSCREVQDSISAFYYTPFISVFCGIIVTIAIFLFTYPGFNAVDRWTTNIAGLFAIGIALFPTSFDGSVRNGCQTAIESSSHTISTIHGICAAAFFIIIASIACFLFTKTNQPTSRSEKVLRNRIYIGCGIIMYVSIALIALHQYNIVTLPQSIRPVFLFETTSLFAFGVAWLIKGEALFADGSKSFNQLPQALKPTPKTNQTIAN
jgi:phosphoglycerol transferase MdoB-like AlkP superfamily enzyme